MFVQGVQESHLVNFMERIVFVTTLSDTLEVRNVLQIIKKMRR
jgi:hypothetical protein